MPFLEDSRRVSRVWGDILLVASCNPLLGNFYQYNYKIVVGNGSRIRFWVDKWVGDLCLNAMFPRLSLLSVEKEVSLRLLVERKAKISVAEADVCLRWIASPVGVAAKVVGCAAAVLVCSMFEHMAVCMVAGFG
ncbi:hypothetical protein LOK49_Contig124G00002 [Camellia lanceoleosa]|nr:hypothetical protein LOK49_Contig124G00002 [Camellia lanceoleosa]